MHPALVMALWQHSGSSNFTEIHVYGCTLVGRGALAPVGQEYVSHIQP
jgi:hypothetical protein